MDPYIVLLFGLGIVVLLTAWLPMLLRNQPLSLPIVCVLFGVGLFSLPGTGPDPDPLKYGVLAEHLTELIVIVALMGAGLRIDRPLDWRRWNNTWRLLGITMPLSIAAMAVVGWGVVGLSIPAALLLAAALAPTDPVLAADVQVGPPRSGIGGEVRFALTSEAGLNDGLAFPFTYLALWVAVNGPAPDAWLLEWLARDVVWRIAVGIGIGWVTGRLLIYLIFRLPRRTRLADTRDGFVALGVTFVSYGLTEMAHGFGFVAVFITALQLRRGERLHEYHDRLHDFAEQTERLLMMILLVLFGGAIAGGLLGSLSWSVIVATALILLVVRPVAGMVGLIGTRYPLRERAAISWFGIRGIGSFYYLAFATNELEFVEETALWAVMGTVVVTSIFLHGVTATPVMAHLDRLGQRRKTVDDHGTPPEAVMPERNRSA